MKNLFKLYVIIGLIGFVSCTGNFLEINTNPNEPENVPSAPILTWVQREMSGAYYGSVWYNANESSSMSGQITKIAYIDETRYAYRAGEVDNMFQRPYGIIRNLNRILINEEGPDGNPNMTAIALILKCFLYHTTTDQLGDIPYSEAFQAVTERNFTPKYDSQESIYRDLLKVLKEASDMIVDVNTPIAYRVTGADIIYGGNMTRWKRFANSLRLRLAVRMSSADEAGARTVINEILGNPDKYPLLGSNADNARFKFAGDANHREPLSASQLSRKDYIMCDIIVNILNELNDPRLPVFAQPAPEDGAYRGIIAGAKANGALANLSQVGAFFSENVAGFFHYFRYAEVEFLKAEVFERGLYSGNAEAAYNAGVTASIMEYSAVTPGKTTSESQVAPYLASPKVAYTSPELPNLKFAGNDPDHNCDIPAGIVNNECANAIWRNNPRLQKIAYQKWISLFQQGMEPWAEVRRTDIPVIGPAPGRAASLVNHNRSPFRFPYSFNEQNSVNVDNARAAAVGIVDLYWGKQMWWDKRTGVQ